MGLPGFAALSAADRVKLKTHPLTWGITLIRLLAALLIVVQPVWGWLVAVLFDILDGQILLHRVKLSPLAYHMYDKYVDTVQFSLMLLVSVRYGILLPLTFLLVYRLIGHFIFWRTRKKKYLILFPNMFEVVWLWFIWGKELGFTARLTPHQQAIGILVLLVYKLLHEYFVHIFGPNTVFPYLKTVVRMVLPGNR